MEEDHAGLKRAAGSEKETIPFAGPFHRGRALCPPSYARHIDRRNPKVVAGAKFARGGFFKFLFGRDRPG
jgi:hypothetical protein